MAEIYRKYLSEQEDKLEDQTDWGISVLTVGHNIHKAKTIYPDKSHPNSYYFDWEKGRILNEFQLVYISNGNGVFGIRNVWHNNRWGWNRFSFISRNTPLHQQWCSSSKPKQINSSGSICELAIFQISSNEYSDDNWMMDIVREFHMWFIYMSISWRNEIASLFQTFWRITNHSWGLANFWSLKKRL